MKKDKDNDNKKKQQQHTRCKEIHNPVLWVWRTQTVVLFLYSLFLPFICYSNVCLSLFDSMCVCVYVFLPLKSLFFVEVKLHCYCAMCSLPCFRPMIIALQLHSAVASWNTGISGFLGESYAIFFGRIS